MTFVVKDGVVQNVIEIGGMSRAEYERLEQCVLVDVEGHFGVNIAIPTTQGFSDREGVRVDALKH